MMDWRYTLYVIFLSVAAAILVGFALRAWRRRGSLGATRRGGWVDWRYTLCVFFLSVAAAILVGFALRAWRRRSTLGATALAVLMVAGAVWAGAYALPLVAAEPSMRIFWGEIKYLGIVVVPLIWVIFALQYTGREEWVRRHTLALLAVEPTAAL